MAANTTSRSTWSRAGSSAYRRMARVLHRPSSNPTMSPARAGPGPGSVPRLASPALCCSRAGAAHDGVDGRRQSLEVTVLPASCDVSLITTLFQTLLQSG